MLRYLEPRPLLTFTAAFLTSLAIGPLGLALLGLPIILRSRQRSIYIALLLGSVLGWLRISTHPEPAFVAEEETSVTGTVTDEPRSLPERRRNLSEVDEGDAPFQTQFHLRTDHGLLRVYRIGPLPTFRRGDKLQIEGRLAPPQPPTNPGQPDRVVQFRRQGIVGTLRSYEKHALAVMPGWHPLRPLDALRRKIRGTLEAHTQPGTSALLSALVLGYRDGIPEDLTTALQRSGTAHFLSISGTHLALIFVLLHGLTLLAGLRGRTQRWSVLALLTFYTLLTGLNVAVLRSYLMIVIYLSGDLLLRRRDAGTSVASAALLITAVDPSALYEPSFQLSFAAVVGIFWISPVFHDFLAAPARLASLFSVSLGAWLATAPISQSVFHLVTPLILFWNILLWPLIALLIAIGLILPLLAWSPAAPLLGGAADLLVSLLRLVSVPVTEALAPVSYFYSPAPSPFLLGTYYALLFAWTLLCRRRPGWRSTLLSLPLVSLLALPLLHRDRVDHLFVAQLDVGRGLCTYVEFPDGRNFVYDAGSLDYRDPGAAILAPYLWSRGIRQVDTLFLSHADDDHLNGARTLIERFRVRQIVTTPYLEHPLLDSEIPVRRVRVDGDVPLSLTPEIEVLSPPAWEETGRPVASNETSLVLRVDRKVLLTGDIQNQATARLLERPWDLHAGLLAAPHHGKRLEHFRELGERTGATDLLVSASEGYYSKDTLASFPGRIWITGDRGAIEVELATPIRVRPFSAR